MSQESNKERSTKIKATPRAIAMVGPHGGGKTTLLESIAVVRVRLRARVRWPMVPAWATIPRNPGPAR